MFENLILDYGLSPFVLCALFIGSFYYNYKILSQADDLTFINLIRTKKLSSVRLPFDIVFIYVASLVVMLNLFCNVNLETVIKHSPNIEPTIISALTAAIVEAFVGIITVTKGIKNC